MHHVSLGNRAWMTRMAPFKSFTRMSARGSGPQEEGKVHSQDVPPHLGALKGSGELADQM